MPVPCRYLLLGVLALGAAATSHRATAQSSIFEDMVVDALPPVQFSAVAWGDYDGDGDFDLLITGNRETSQQPVPITQLYLNQGDGTIEDVVDGVAVEVPVTNYVDGLNPNLAVLTDLWQSAVAWGDYDNDGDLDLLAAGLPQNGAPGLYVYQNDGTADRFQLRWTAPGVHAGDLAWGDFDNDGDLDFVAAGLGPDGRSTTLLYENQVRTGGDFTVREAGLTGLAHGSVAWGDYDGDDDLDLLVAGLTEPQAFVTRVYRNDGGAFTDAGAVLEGLLFASVAWGDYDNDGDLDVLLTGARLTPIVLEGVIRVYRNDGSAFTDVSDQVVGGFENDPVSGRYQGAAAWGDYNGDGRLDFLITGEEKPNGVDRGQVYANFGNDTFAKMASEKFEGGLFGGAFWGDYDGDGDLDLFAHGQDPGRGKVVRVLRNPLGNNAPPTAPVGLQATTQGGSVVLTWTSATDAQTPSPGLTYNLRVGTTPGATDIVSPMADLATGARLLSAPGNAGHGAHWTLTGLASGTYHWSVQAIDTSYQGSPFAVEDTFTIP